MNIGLISFASACSVIKMKYLIAEMACIYNFTIPWITKMIKNIKRKQEDLHQGGNALREKKVVSAKQAKYK